MIWLFFFNHSWDEYSSLLRAYDWIRHGHWSTWLVCADLYISLYSGCHKCLNTFSLAGSRSYKFFFNGKSSWLCHYWIWWFSEGMISLSFWLDDDWGGSTYSIVLDFWPAMMNKKVRSLGATWNNSYLDNIVSSIRLHFFFWLVCA